MYKFKLRKSLIITMSTIGVLLSSCDVGKEPKQMSNIPKSTWKISNTDNGMIVGGNINDANGVWFAIDKNDYTATDGTVNFIYNNNTGQTAQLVGCNQYRSDDTGDGDPIFDFSHLTDIPAGASQLIRGAKNGSEALVKFYGTNNIIAPVSEQTFKGSITSRRGANLRDYTGICYYKIPVPNSNKYLYFGLSINSEQWRTYDAIFDTVDKPLNDLKKFHSDHRNQFSEGFDIVTPVVALNTVSRAAVRTPIYAQLELQHVIDMAIRMQRATIAEINKQAAIKNSPTSTAAEKQDAIDKLMTQLDKNKQDQGFGFFRGHKNIDADTYKKELQEFVDNFSKIERKSEFVVNVNGEKLYLDKYVAIDRNGEMFSGQRGWEDVISNKETSSMEAIVPYEVDYTDYKETYEAIVAANTEEGKGVDRVLDNDYWLNSTAMVRKSKTPDGISGLLKREMSHNPKRYGIPEDAKLAYTGAINETSYINSGASSIINSEDVIGSERFMNPLLNVEVKTGSEITFGTAASATGVGFLWEVFTWFTVQPLFNRWFDYDQIGKFATGLMHGNLFIPLEGDVEHWNARNPRNQIAYTTKMITDTYDDPTNSFRQQIGFTLLDGFIGEDKQIRYDINMTYLTTPFLRITESNGKSPEIDPYLQQGSGASSDSVFTFTINAVTPRNETRDLDDYIAGMLNQAGLSAWVPNYLPAPTVQTTQIAKMSNDTNKPVLDIGILKSAPVLSSNTGLGLMSVGGIKGLFIGPNTLVNLGISLDNNGGNKNQKTGTGFIANYISSGITSESSTQVYSVTGSQSEFNNLKSNVPLFYRAFTCEFPYEIGSTCNLSLAVSGNGNNGVDEGKLYLSDASGREIAIPVYLGYKLVAEPRSVTGQVLNDGEGLIRTMNFANASSQRYSTIKVEGELPSTVKITSNSCTGGLDPQKTCSIVYDFGEITKRVHTTISYTGVVDGQEPTKADVKTIPFDVSVENF